MKLPFFVLDFNVTKCAESYTDQHLMEAPSAMCEVLRAANSDSHPLKKHVLTKWCLAAENYTWMRYFVIALLSEQIHRFGDCQREVADEFWAIPKWQAKKEAVRFLQLVPVTIPGDPLTAYRNYYQEEFKGAAWTKRKAPKWWAAPSQRTLDL